MTRPENLGNLYRHFSTSRLYCERRVSVNSGSGVLALEHVLDGGENRSLVILGEVME